MAGQSEKKLEMLMKKSEELFFKFGYNGVAMDRIAAEAGISKMTIYKHFSSKEELFVAVMRNNIRRHMDEARRLMDKKYHTVEKIGALYDYSINAAKLYPHILLKDIVERKSLFESIGAIKQETALPLWRYILEDGISKKEIRNIDLNFISELLMNLPYAIKNLDFLEDEDKLMKFYRNFIDFIKYGLLGGLEVVEDGEGCTHEGTGRQ